MDLKSELLKSIWYAFTSLDVEKCGKVSKSQLKVRRILVRDVFKIRKLRPRGVRWREHRDKHKRFIFLQFYFGHHFDSV